MFIVSIIIAVIILNIIVVVHELGHFVFARLFNVPVYEFSIGMGKRLISFIYHNTRFSLKLFPIGGSCSMVGEDIAGSGDFSDSLGKVNYDNNTVEYNGVVYDLDYINNNNFSKINPIKKIIICFAGPLFNIILALICSLVFVLISGYVKPTINDVVKQSPADISSPYSLQKDDLITSIETIGYKQNVATSEDLIIFIELHKEEISKNKYPVSLSFIRDKKQLKTLIYPSINEDNSITLGFSIGSLSHPTKISELLYYSFYQTFSYINITILSLKMLFVGKFKINDLSGPVGTVAVMSSGINDAKSFLSKFVIILLLINVISTNLGVMNLLPIPALDGGRIIESLFELIFRKQIDAKILEFINSFTLILLLILMVYVLGQDIFKIIIGAL